MALLACASQPTKVYVLMVNEEPEAAYYSESEAAAALSERASDLGCLVGGQIAHHVAVPLLGETEKKTSDQHTMDPSSLGRRLGRFTISMTLIEENPEAARAALEGCVVVRAEAMWHTHAIEYVAMHDNFDEVPPEMTVPIYIWEMAQHEDGTIIRKLRRQS